MKRQLRERWTGLAIAVVAALFWVSAVKLALAQPAADDPPPPPAVRRHFFPPGSGIPSPTVITQATALSLAQAMDVTVTQVVSASFLGSDPHAFGLALDVLGDYFPAAGDTFAILSTGLAASADDPNDQPNLSAVLDGQNNNEGHDLSQLSVSLAAPAGTTCAHFDFAFYSEEFPEFIGSQFNDVFTAERGGTNLTVAGGAVTAPLNFALDFDGRAISVNSTFGVVSPTLTTYDGSTPLLHAQTPVTPGMVERFVFSVQDLGDSSYDSAVFVDNWRWSSSPDCAAGVRPTGVAIVGLSGKMTDQGGSLAWPLIFLSGVMCLLFRLRQRTT